MTTNVDIDTAELRKARGAFFTPPPVCSAAADWAVRRAGDSVLEPSCGEAAFLLAAARRLQELGARDPELHGYELHEASAHQATKLVQDVEATSNIRVGDFLLSHAEATYDAVVGNPPFIRYQGFTGSARAAGIEAAEVQGVRLTNLASSWAPFVVHSAAFLRPAGRLAFVLPAELLSSNYAADVRAFLLRRFASLKVVLFDHHVFPGVQTEALLLLAEGTGGTSEVSFARVSNTSELDELDFAHSLKPATPGAKWTTALVATTATASLHELTTRGSFSQLAQWGRLSLGAVTGNNNWFTLTRSEAEALGLGRSDLTRISLPGSSHLRALSLTRSDLQRLENAGARTLLFKPAASPSAAARRYIAAGEALGVHEAYKCRVRPVWWQVPLPAAPDIFVTCMNAQTPQLAANPERLRHLNSVHGLYLDESSRHLTTPLAVATLNSATMLSAEIVGRSYGGGVLKVEPREAAAMAVPSRTLIDELEGDLKAIAPDVRTALKAGRLDEAVSMVDGTVLTRAGMTDEAIIDLRRARNLLAHRRQSRARSKSGGVRA